MTKDLKCEICGHENTRINELMQAAANFDFASLYPSVMTTYNVMPDTSRKVKRMNGIKSILNDNTGSNRNSNTDL